MRDFTRGRRMLRLARMLTELTFLCVLVARPCAADEKGAAILREAFAKMQAARTMTAKLDVTMSQVGSKMRQHATGVLVAMKPNFLRFEQAQNRFAQEFRKQLVPAFVREIRRAAEEDLSRLSAAALLERLEWACQRKHLAVDQCCGDHGPIRRRTVSGDR